MKRQGKLLLIGFLSIWPVVSMAQPIDHAYQYKSCMTLVHEKPGTAFDSALTWKSHGGGEAADHCIATALIALKNYRHGAERLEELADRTRRSASFKAKLLGQAAQGWFLADELDRARAVLTSAIELDPDNLELYVDRAHIRSQQQAYRAALDDLNLVLEKESEHVDALVFRGTIYRLTDNLEKAWGDIKKATALDPSHSEALLERGMLYRLEGNKDQARKDWLNVIALDHNPEAVELARLNLQRMELHAEQ